MIIMKFGGSSLANSERIQCVSKIIKDHIDQKPVIVLSALGDTTDFLEKSGINALKGNVNIDDLENFYVNTAKELSVKTDVFLSLFEELKNLLLGISMIRELSNKTRDYLMSFGERLSVRLISSYFNSQGIVSRHMDGWEAGFVSNSRFTQADILDETFKNIKFKLNSLKNNYEYTPIITGFIGKDTDGNITTFGRGGSDLTACVLGVALNVVEIQTWKDVNGILTADPRKVKDAKPVEKLSFNEVSEMSYFGANVLQPGSILSAMKNNIPVRVKNSYNPDHPGTLIVKEMDFDENPVRAITTKSNITLVDIESTRMIGQVGFLAKVFNIFEKLSISVDVIATSEVSISLTLDNPKNLFLLENEIGDIGNINITSGKSMISIISDVKKSSETLSKVFTALNNENIHVQMISHGASRVNTTILVDDGESDNALNILHQLFF